MEPPTEVFPQSLPIRAFLVSGVRLYREGVESALGRSGTIAMVGMASSFENAMDRVASLEPAVILVDMSTRDSLAGIRALAALAPRCKLVAFAVDELTSDIPSCAEAGIAGYVPCDASLHDLVTTIESVTREEAPCSPRVAAALFRHIARLASSIPAALPDSILSRRERQILALIQNGLSNKEIAQTLTIEVTTVKNHVHSVLTKLHVSTRGQAAILRYAAPASRCRI